VSAYEGSAAHSIGESRRKRKINRILTRGENHSGQETNDKKVDFEEKKKKEKRLGRPAKKKTKYAGRYKKKKEAVFPWVNPEKRRKKRKKECLQTKGSLY